MHLASVSIQGHRFPDLDIYPFNQPVLKETDQIEFSTPVTFFVGENGAGKTTLLEALCRRCGIHIWQDPDRKRFIPNRHEKQLHRFLDIEWADGQVPGSFFGSDTFRHFTRSLDEWASADPQMRIAADFAAACESNSIAMAVQTRLGSSASTASGKARKRYPT